MSLPYSSKVMQHFFHPKNMGKIKNADGIGKVGNLRCGDVMWLYIKIAKNKSGKEIIKNIKFETFGCVAALATSSAITELAMGKSLDKALKISRSKIVKNLGGLPPIKLHCSVLAADALDEAIYDYLQRNKKEIPLELQKRHEIALRSKEVIEHRYHDWTNIEEKLHQKK